jgi:hypothetical protein
MLKKLLGLKPKPYIIISWGSSNQKFPLKEDAEGVQYCDVYGNIFFISGDFLVGVHGGKKAYKILHLW